MRGRLDCIDQYLSNSQHLFQALKDNDLEAVNHCLEKNLTIMRDYELAEFAGLGSRGIGALRAKIETIRQTNQQCLLYAEIKCRELRGEIESVDKNKSGIVKYRAQRTQIPRFVDNIA